MHNQKYPKKIIKEVTNDISGEDLNTWRSSPPHPSGGGYLL